MTSLYYVPQDDTTAYEPRPGWYVRTARPHRIHGPFFSRAEAQEATL